MFDHAYSPSFHLIQ